MTLKFKLMPADWEPAEQPQWYLDMLKKQREFNSKHPRCIGCGVFVRKHANICPNCKDY